MNGQLKHFGFKLGMKIISTISTSRIETQYGVTDGDERKLGASFSLGFNWNLFVTNELKSKTFVQFFLDLSYTQFLSSYSLELMKDERNYLKIFQKITISIFCNMQLKS